MEENKKNAEILDAENLKRLAGNEKKLVNLLKEIITVFIPIVLPVITIIGCVNVSFYYWLFGISILKYITVSDIVTQTIENLVSYTFLFMLSYSIIRVLWITPGFIDAYEEQYGKKPPMKQVFYVILARNILSYISFGFFYMIINRLFSHGVAIKFLLLCFLLFYGTGVFYRRMVFTGIYTLRTAIIMLYIASTFITIGIYDFLKYKTLVEEKTQNVYVELNNGFKVNQKSDTVLVGITSDFVFFYDIKSENDFIFPKSALAKIIEPTKKTSSWFK